jgi:hypothetical protein
VNDFSQIRDPHSMVYLDDGRYRGFWVTWAFGQETAVHAPRLMPRALMSGAGGRARYGSSNRCVDPQYLWDRLGRMAAEATFGRDPKAPDVA